jgi:RNA polymerase sigma-70 factor (ECF subfamily)
LFLRHKDRLWFVALRVTRNREDAADAVQEAMISAFRRAETFRGDAAVSSWLHRITVNAALDRIAKRKRQPTSSIDDVESELGAASVQSGSTTSAFGQVEANLEISKALSGLSDDRRSAIILVDLYGYSLAEAADILEIPEGTVKSRLFRARCTICCLTFSEGVPTMSRDDEFSGDGAVDPRLNELLSDYREFLDEVPAGESMPEDVALNIREAIAREPLPSPSSTTRPVNRSMLALAASVAVIGIGIGATVIVTNQPDVQQEPIRASAVDDGSAGDDGGATTQPLPSSDFTIALSATDSDAAGVIVPTDVQPGDELAVVFALEGPESAAAQEVTELCGKESKRVGVVLPDITSNSPDQDAAQARLDAVTLVREELSDYAGISDAWYAVGDVSSGDPAIVAGVQQGLFEPITDITSVG